MQQLCNSDPKNKYFSLFWNIKIKIQLFVVVFISPHYLRITETCAEEGNGGGFMKLQNRYSDLIFRIQYESSYQLFSVIMFLKICFILNIIQIYTLFKQQAEFQYFLERVPVPVPVHQYTYTVHC